MYALQSFILLLPRADPGDWKVGSVDAPLFILRHHPCLGFPRARVGILDKSWPRQKCHCPPDPVIASLYGKGILQALLDNRFRGRKTTSYCLNEPCLVTTSLKKGAPVPALARKRCSGRRGARRCGVKGAVFASLALEAGGRVHSGSPFWKPLCKKSREPDSALRITLISTFCEL